MQMTNLKRETEQRHDNELKYTKERWASKLDRERANIENESKSLIEQSGDIRGHLKHFKKDLYDNKMDEKRFEIKESQRDRLAKHRLVIDQRVESKRMDLEVLFDKKLK